MDNVKIEKVINALKKKNFKACYFQDAKSAKAAVMDLISDSETVGIGGSVTIHDMGIHSELQERGNQVFWHWLVPPAERNEARIKAAHADVYLSSTNALTVSGELVNIDGTGNRVSSMFFGPKKVIIVCGINKIAEDYDSAINRIKTVACPANARRLKLNTPCAITGKCTDCKTDDRMCKITVKIEYPPVNREIYVFLVGETLGY